ncbi:Uncharacterised protein [Acinetobacter baumannii]|nr:Uncharacterised protein [Acinetobacter baumannii]SSS43424.1 Uncharacterised protein [Acinetobacter baumannii]SSU37963.1 Uncharacterised protein [Acinetobacter baumannii]SSU38020.1 Uncharacterised protein [Acinetobacter baumannii]SSU53374.1 Uncharacterised protein [Acinetobacter baumannii]
MRFASWSITSRFAPTIGARSVLLIISKSDLVIPGPPLRGIFSPPATSMTYKVKSESSGLNVAAKLSPPLSIIMSSKPSNFSHRSSIAAKLIEASSRIAVCGQPPVSTPTIRSGDIASLRVKKFESSLV